MKQYDYPLPQFARLSEEARERLKRRMEELERQQKRRETEANHQLFTESFPNVI